MFSLNSGLLPVPPSSRLPGLKCFCPFSSIAIRSYSVCPVTPRRAGYLASNRCLPPAPPFSSPPPTKHPKWTIQESLGRWQHDAQRRAPNRARLGAEFQARRRCQLANRNSPRPGRWPEPGGGEGARERCSLGGWLSRLGGRSWYMTGRRRSPLERSACSGSVVLVLRHRVTGPGSVHTWLASGPA